VLEPNIKYGLQLAFGAGDFEPDNSSPIYDAWVESTHLRDLNVRVGQFFVPFDRARTIREFALQLVDRHQVVRELNLDRDVGVAFQSQDLLGLGGLLNYALFVGGGDGKNRVGGTEPGPIVTLRLAVKPFGAFDDDTEGDLKREMKPRLSVGIAGGYNSNATRVGSTTGATFTLGTVDYQHAAADLHFKYAGFSFLAEALVRDADDDGFSTVVDGELVEEFSRSGWGYFAQAGFMVTDLFEVVGRWGQLFAFDGTDPAFVQSTDEQGNEIGGGLNLYLNGHAFKVQTDYVLLFREDASSLGRELWRVALDATF
jgi:hypothetical protein